MGREADVHAGLSQIGHLLASGEGFDRPIFFEVDGILRCANLPPVREGEHENEDIGCHGVSPLWATSFAKYVCQLGLTFIDFLVTHTRRKTSAKSSAIGQSSSASFV